MRMLQPSSDLASSIEAVMLDALHLRLREVVDQLGSFEARHGQTLRYQHPPCATFFGARFAA